MNFYTCQVFFFIIIKHIWECTILCKKVPKTNTNTKTNQHKYEHKYNQYNNKHKGVPAFSLHEEVRGFVTYSNREVACLPLHLILAPGTHFCDYLIFVQSLFCICTKYVLYLHCICMTYLNGEVACFSPQQNHSLRLIWSKSLQYICCLLAQFTWVPDMPRL